MEDILKNEILRIELAPENTSKERLIEIIQELGNEVENYTDCQQDIGDLEDEIDSLNDKIIELKSENHSLEDENDKLEDKVEELEAEIEILTTKNNEKTL